MKNQRTYHSLPTIQAFSLIEILLAVAVLAIIVTFVAQLTNTASSLITQGNKHLDVDSEARVVLDRIGIDIANMLKRSDVDYWLKQSGARYYPGHSAGHSNGNGHSKQVTQQGSDQMAFYSQVPGYYPSGYSSTQNSPISLVAYRINTTSNQMERMCKGLLWNGVSNPTGQNPVQPVLFSPSPIPSTLTIATNWQAATNTNFDSDYEVIGPNIFRFEYYYLLKNGQVTDNPWDTDTTLVPLHTSINGLTDVQAILVAIAAIDSKSRPLLSDQNVTDLISNMIDFRNAPGKSGNSNGQKKTGDVEYQWATVINGNTGIVPLAAAQAIRVYARCYNLSLP